MRTKLLMATGTFILAIAFALLYGLETDRDQMGMSAASAVVTIDLALVTSIIAAVSLEHYFYNKY